MFVYRYMAGQVSTLLGSNEPEEDFDPYKHRNIPKPTTYLETMMHMMRAAVGAGMLAMPYAMSRLGIIFGATFLVFISVFATYCIQILIVAQYLVCKKARRGYMSYPRTMRLAVEAGPPFMRWTARLFSAGVDVLLVIWQIGICAIFLVFVAENSKQLLDYYGYDISIRRFIFYTFPVVLVMGLVKDLKVLAPFSTFSNFATLTGVMLVFFYLIEDDVTLEEDKFQVKGLVDIPIFIGIVLFALEAVGVVLALEYNMERPERFVGLYGLFTIGMCIITVVYAVLGIFGYLKYGSDIQGSITLNLPKDQKKAQLAKFLISFAIFLSYPLQNFVAWQILWRKIKKYTQKKAADYALRVVCTTLPFALAVTAPSLGPFMGLIGALCLSLVAVLYPAVMDLSVYYPDKYGLFNYKVFVDIFIIIFGAFCCCSGIYTSLLEMYED